MALASELLRRLGQMPSQRRAEFLQRLHASEDNGKPLSFRQEQLWAAAALDAGDSFGLSFGYRLRGPLDPEALTAALDDVFERHDILRSAFVERDGAPVQVAIAHRTVQLPVEDVRHLEARGAEERIHALLEQDARRGFDLETGPMVRLRLVRLADAEHLLLWTTHYMVFDVESASLVLHELAAAYEARAAGRAPELPAPGPTYGEFAAWQRGWADGDEAQELLRGWRESLSGWEATELLTDHRRPPRLDLSGGTVRRELGDADRGRAEALAASLRVRPEALHLAVYAALLHRYTRQTDVVVGVPVRLGYPGAVAPAVGNYGSVVPVRLDLADDPTFEDLAVSTQRALDGAYARSAVPFELVLHAAQASGDLSRLSLIRLGFAFAAELPPDAQAGDLRLSVERFPTGIAGFEVLCTLQAGGSRVDAEYSAVLFEQGTIGRLLDRYSRLLQAAVSEPGLRQSRLPLLPAGEREQVVVDWNRTDRARPAELIHEVCSDVASRRDGAVAVVDAEGETSYRDLDERSARLAQHLARAGVGPEQRVAVFLERGRRLVEATLGVLRAGAAYVPVEASHPDERVAATLEDAGVSAVVTQVSLLERLPAGPWQVVALDRDAEALAQLPASPPHVHVEPEHAAYVLYTSGSTGVPKGVVIEHRNVVNFVRTVQEWFELGPEDRITQFASLGFDVSVFEIFGALFSGGRLYVVNDEEKRSLEALEQVLREEGITVADLPPALLELLPPEELPGLRLLFVGLEAFSGELTTRWAAGGRSFYNGYGPTEATVAVIAKRCEGIWTSSPPIGRAMDNHQAYVLDTHFEPVGVDIPGELAVAGAGVGRGYLGRPEQTAERFRPDPFGPPGSRLYLTGDLVKWLPDGDLLFLGRVDRQVKVRGVRVEPGEIESVLAQHEHVAQALVQAVRDPRGDTVLVAYTVAASEAEPAPDALREHLARKLPPSMVPTLLVSIERVPLTANGKVDVRALPAVDFSQLVSPEDDEDLRTPTERRLAQEVFAPMLSLPRVGLHDNFFALGGTSLQAFRIVPRVQEVFGVKLPLPDFFQNPTVAQVAAILDRLQGTQTGDREQDLLAALSEVEGRSDEEVEEMLRQPPGPDRA